MKGLIALAAVVLSMSLPPASGQASRVLGNWITHGADLFNRRWAEGETLISPLSVKNLTMRWNFVTGGDVTATPAVYNNAVYFPDWAGFLYALDRRTGALIWKKSFAADYGFPVRTFSRATPSIAPASKCPGLKEDMIVIGTANPAVVIAVSLTTGGLLWKTTVGDFPVIARPKVTGSVTIFKDGVYVGVASDEELSAADPSYKCCVFKGSLAKLKLISGKTVWQTYTLPDEPGYSGASIWGATPAIDVERQLVYAGVGNMYTLPPAVEKCIEDNPNRTSPDPCISPGNKQDSIISVDTTTGEYRWSTSLGPIDAWTVACLTGDPSNPNCPKAPGPDYDFGLNPLLITIADPRPGKKGMMVDVAIAGQKSGIVYALERATGAVVWSVQAGPGGVIGGVIWGMATDGVRVFAGQMNGENAPFYLSTLNITVTSGAWVALDANTGKPLWYYPNPNPVPNWAMLPSVANGVMFAGSSDPKGHVYALDAATGTPLWEFVPGTSVYAGVSISQGCIFFGHGYGSLAAVYGTTGGGPQNLFSFCVPGA